MSEVAENAEKRSNRVAAVTVEITIFVLLNIDFIKVKFEQLKVSKKPPSEIFEQRLL